jgi:hypothetical protein
MRFAFLNKFLSVASWSNWSRQSVESMIQRASKKGVRFYGLPGGWELYYGGGWMFGIVEDSSRRDT